LRIPEVGSNETTPQVRPTANHAEPDQDESSLASGSDQAPGDRLDISSAATAASQGIQNHEDRIAELRQAYLSGSYQPDAAKIAAKIVDEHLK
jgi:flagellar biosynthesis anti-sigma factor FlgM